MNLQLPGSRYNYPAI